MIKNSAHFSREDRIEDHHQQQQQIGVVFEDHLPLDTNATVDQSVSGLKDETKRRSTFYVPLNNHQIDTDEIYSLDLSSCSFDWSLNDSLSSSSDDILTTNSANQKKTQTESPPLKTTTTTSKFAKTKTIDHHQRSGILIGEVIEPLHRLEIAINDDDPRIRNDHEKVILSRRISSNSDHQPINNSTSTPIRLIAKSRSRSNILNLTERINLTNSPLKEKSKTLPQNLTNNSESNSSHPLPHKTSFLLKSSPKIMESSLASDSTQNTIALTAKSPRKSLSFIRRSHSTKVSRSNSLLRSLTRHSNDHQDDREDEMQMVALNVELLERLYKLPSDDFEVNLRRIFFKDHHQQQHVENDHHLQQQSQREQQQQQTEERFNSPEKEDEGVHSDTSYEKACRRGSAPTTPILGQNTSNTNDQPTISRFTNFFSKRSFRSNPLKRTKSVTKLERSKRGPGGGLRGSRSHESLLSSHAVMSTIDLSCTGAVGVAAVHQSVLGRRHCFQVRGGPRGERYYSCGSRQERDLWIYSLRKSIQPNVERTRHMDNSLKMWIYEAKALPPKKKYFCEINLDKTLYGRTSVKLRTDLLFWGEYFDFPDIPDINVITVNVFRECEKKKKRDKHSFVGSVKIPIHEVTTKAICEDWYPIMSDKHNSISRNSAKEIIPTLRIKCRFQSIDILPINLYSEFLHYLKENYKKVCEMLEPVIGVKAKEDIGQALVLLMHSQGMASAFLTDVVALDLLRVGDQRLTFRGNSLATKSMEAFLKLTGEQYLQDTLSVPISEIISSDRDCEVDPLKANGSLSRQQQSLRNAVKVAWKSVAESTRHFPPQLKECFATFRERLVILDREDMADNLISASIFLRFLCPAILSPSLFNITNELPSARATRNLTLVAKTLQTLANFTRFQAKESFMEFLNDFLEQEAPRMKEFLHSISTRSADHSFQESSILDWSGYIDQGKQLSILHTLLSENLSKLPANRQHEMQDLVQILERISKAKETVSYLNHEEEDPHNQNQENHPQQIHLGKESERGIIRGVLTPSSLEKNIFRFNDPTVAPLIQNLNAKQSQNMSNLDGMASLQHSHSTSSISSAPNYYYNVNNHLNSTPSKSSRKAVQNHHYPIANSMEAICGHNKMYNQHPHEIKHISHHVYDGLMNNSSSSSGSYRSNTLPKNNGISSTNSNHSMVAKMDGDEKSGANLIHIGLDPSSAFVRKSPTPLLKSSHSNLTAAGLLQQKNRLNDSQLSLLSDRSSNKYNLNIGIPHNDHHQHHVNYLPAVGGGGGGGVGQHQKANFKMPMNLEDLDDLLKYADEQNDIVAKKKIQDMENGNEVDEEEEEEEKIKPKELLTAKGSNNSIGQLSNMCSSGYQSITTQSQSSSPIENSHDFLKNGRNLNNPPIAPQRNGPLKYQFGGTKATVTSVMAMANSLNNNSNNNNVILPNGKNMGPSSLHSSQKSSSLTPSSSEERLSGDHHFHNRHHNGNGVLVNGSKAVIGEIRGESELNMVTSVLNATPPINGSRLNGNRRNYGRTPRTNPLFYNGSETNRSKIEDLDDSLTYSPRDEGLHQQNHHSLTSGSSRFQRRLSLESARTLSDSSTDTEGLGLSVDGKRRRNCNRSVEQCEREIQRLQASVDSLRHKLEESDLRDSNNDLLSLSNHSDSKMRSIISRLIAMEEELRREQLKMSLALSHKQRVIEAQGQQIAALDAANNRLLSALSSLRQRYESQQSSDPTNKVNQQHGQASTTC